MKKNGLGVVAALTPGLTVHTDTFVEAVKQAVRDAAPDVQRDVVLHWVCDRMSGDGGEAAAREFVSAGVDCVVGHFSSRAALASMPIYRDAGVPLILPCASQDGLLATNVEEKGSTLAFRLTASNRMMLEVLFRCLIPRAGLSHKDTQLWSGPSPYGDALAAVARSLFPFDPKPKGGKGYVLLGHENEVAAKLGELRLSGFSGPVFLVDDAISSQFGMSLPSCSRSGVFGLTSSLVDYTPEASMQNVPPFFRETYVAISIALQAISSGLKHAQLAHHIETTNWHTPMGNAKFNRYGENEHTHYWGWEFRNETFTPLYGLGISTRFGD